MLSRSGAVRLGRLAREEIERALQGIRPTGHPRPFYISHLIRDEDSWRLRGKYGTLARERNDRRRTCYTDVRVGSYRKDQVQDGGLQDNSNEDESYGYLDLPTGDRPDGVRHGLWRLTEARYREAAEGYLRRKAHELTYLNPHRHLASFEKRDAVVQNLWKKLAPVDLEEWRRFITRASAVPTRFPMIKDSYVDLSVRHQVSVYTNSEGSEQIQCRQIWSLECYLWLLPQSGEAQGYSLVHTVSDPRELPDAKAFHRQIRQSIRRLEEQSRAPALRSYSGPVLLEPVPAGLLVHEALGHRLEGNRLLCSGEGQTFRDSLGAQVLPDFLSLRDDPTRNEFEGRSLVGHYAFDDEGVPARDTLLIDQGRLCGFLTSRAAIKKRHRSNGHARCRSFERPISRMGVTILESEDGLSDDDLRGALIEEVRRQGLPYGIRILSATGGETATESYNFQAFMGEIDVAARVYPDGREEWIRGVDFVGTPLNAIRGIVAAGSRYEVDNSYCGAESGYVPVSTISPALLVSHLELQSKSDSTYTQYAYRLPWE